MRKLYHSTCADPKKETQQGKFHHADAPGVAKKYTRASRTMNKRQLRTGSSRPGWERYSLSPQTPTRSRSIEEIESDRSTSQAETDRSFRLQTMQVRRRVR
eukprot:5464241-Amphidinium_carterae.1